MALKPKNYMQTDKRWAYEPYRVKGKESSTIGGSGCGPTAAAMIVATIADPKVTPVTACKWSVEHGYKAVGQGTFYSFFEPFFAKYGMKCKQVPGSNSYHCRNTSSDKAALKALKSGKYVIACMGPGLWTNGGHFVVAYKYNEGKVYINDPASTSASRAKNTWDKFQYEAKYYWVVEPWAEFKRKNKPVPVRKQPKRTAKQVAELKGNITIRVNKVEGRWYRLHAYRWVHRSNIRRVQ